MNSKLLKEKVVELRKSGKTYREIQNRIGTRLSKSTLSCWCKNIILDDVYKKRIKILMFENVRKARKFAQIARVERRKSRRKDLVKNNKQLACIISNKNNAMVALVMLYACEGAKSRRGSLMFGNSDPDIISLFLTLLRQCYQIDERKFRCTLQSRADQDVKKLENFWSKLTGVPLTQFYKARADKRSIGKPTKKIDYKGVCRIDYFSADIYWELKEMFSIIHKGIKTGR